MENVTSDMIKHMIQAELDKYSNENCEEIPIPQPDGTVIVYRF